MTVTRVAWDLDLFKAWSSGAEDPIFFRLATPEDRNGGTLTGSGSGGTIVGSRKGAWSGLERADTATKMPRIGV